MITTLENNIIEDEFLNISPNIRQKVEKIAKEIKSCHAQKYERVFKIIELVCRNRRFGKTKRKRHSSERKKDWLERKRQVILSAKANCPD